MIFDAQRKELVDNLRKEKIIISNTVYSAMLKIPRHLFIPEHLQHRSYLDTPQQIDNEQTISAPHMNAMMCEYLEIEKGNKILEIGTGSGYHAALISEIVGRSGKVFSIERHEELATQARDVISKLEIQNIEIIIGDGTLGYEKEAPFDRILVTAAGPKIPKKLLSQLTPNDGIMVIPIGKKDSDQFLYVFKRKGDKYSKEKICAVRFVPLIGEDGN